MAIFFSRIFLRSFRSTCCPTGTAGAPSCLKDLTQMVEQSGGRQEHIGPARLIEVLQKEVGVLVSLFRRFIEIRPGPLPVLFDILSGEVQFSKSVLGVLVALFGGLGEIGHRLWHILRNIFPLKIQFFPGGRRRRCSPCAAAFSYQDTASSVRLWLCRSFPSAYWAKSYPAPAARRNHSSACWSSGRTPRPSRQHLPSW